MPGPPQDGPAADCVDAILGVWRTEGEVLDADGVDVVAAYSGSDTYERFGPFVLHRIDVLMGDKHVEVMEVVGPWDADQQAFHTTVFDAASGTIERSTADVDDAGVWTFRSGHGSSRGRATRCARMTTASASAAPGGAPRMTAPPGGRGCARCTRACRCRRDRRLREDRGVRLLDAKTFRSGVTYACYAPS